MRGAVPAGVPAGVLQVAADGVAVPGGAPSRALVCGLVGQPTDGDGHARRRVFRAGNTRCERTSARRGGDPATGKPKSWLHGAYW
ncbi:hypothetical protein GCM10010324_55680 [Streptomyces hiroshimensis]|uniref:Uncharacterized protein n=1 Tax=Streptomyces hiroshimensis TaxID=66424 RepID=A0ABQ2Z414_9ACTN|nr:hypothetical protein GCM10010324_55680 [Streptomyces hiroshimensis]